MPNKNYINGRNKEYRICKRLKEEGFDIVQRTAGSHSPIDVIAISKSLHVIKFVQAKPKSLSDKIKEKIEEENYWLNNPFRAEFKVI